MVASMMQPRVWGSLLLLIILLILWEWGVQAAGIPKFIIPTVSDIWKEGVRLWTSSKLPFHFGLTLWEVILGFAGGALLGASVGYLLGISRTAEALMSPYILALQIAPKVAFAPLFVMWFGFTIYPKILVAILITFFPVLVNVLAAVRAVEPATIDLARSFKATRAQIFWKIEFPASMPALFSGLRVASTLAVIGVVVGELIGGNQGLGFILTLGDAQGNTAAVFVAIILLTLIGIVAYGAVVIAEGRVLHYQPVRKS